MIKYILSWIKSNPEVIPSTEAVEQISAPKLDRGSSYMVRESRPIFSLEVFAALVKAICWECDHPEAFHCESIGCDGCTLPCPCKGCKYSRAQGLCFTTTNPEEIRQLFTLQTTPIYWISRHGEDSVSPTNLEVMAEMIGRFLRRSKNPVVFFDGVEYMVATVGFIPVLKFLRDLQEAVAIRKAIFIIPINPRALEEKEMALIERDLKEIYPEEETI
jgi:hypothetical protein